MIRRCNPTGYPSRSLATSEVAPVEPLHRDHYTLERAGAYAQHHHKNLRTRLTTRRELAVLERALRAAGAPREVLDLPCGTGRFWPAMAEAGVRSLIAGDNSEGMLEVAAGHRLGAEFPVRLIKTSVFDIDLPDRSVDLVACLRFFHHLAHAEDRRRALAELKRVSRRYVALSLWVDGNLAALRRSADGAESAPRGYGRRRCVRRAVVEAEFEAAGLRVVDHFDVWPRLAMWRLYLLERSP